MFMHHGELCEKRRAARAPVDRCLASQRERRKAKAAVNCAVGRGELIWGRAKLLVRRERLLVMQLELAVMQPAQTVMRPVQTVWWAVQVEQA